MLLLSAAPVVNAVDFDPLLVSSWPGYTRGSIKDVALRGQFAICAADSGGVVVLDLADPSKPRRVGWHDTPGLPQEVAVAGSLAYVADFEGVIILDISDPTQPTRIGSYEAVGQYPVKVIASGSHLFLADYPSGVLVLDVSEPRLPVLAASFGASLSVQGLAFAGDYLYLAARGSGLVAVDVRELATPVTIGYFRDGRDSRAVSAVEDRLYVAGYEELEIFDLADPAAPASLSRSRISVFPTSIKVAHGHAYVFGIDLASASRSTVLEILDVSDPANPRALVKTAAHGALEELSGGAALLTKDGVLQIATLESPSNLRLEGAYAMAGQAQDLFVTNGHAFLADTDAGLRVLDVSDKRSPREVALQPTRGAANDVFVEGRFAYVASGAHGLEVFDVSTPSAPSPVGELDTPGFATGLFVRDNLAFVADGAEGGLRIISIANPAAPATLGSWNTPGTAVEVHVHGDHAFVADEAAGFQIVRIADPANPQRVGVYTNQGNIRHVVPRGDFAYVADWQYNFEVVTITNLARPRRVASIPAGGGWRIALSGQHAYVASGMFGMEVIDISAPSEPKRAGGWDSTYSSSNNRGSGAGIFLADGHLFLADWVSGLQVIDHRNPARYQRGETYPNYVAPPGKAKVFGQTAYLVNDSSVVTAVSVPMSGSPRLSGSIEGSSGVRDIFIDGKIAYLGEKIGRLQVVDISNPFRTGRLGHYQITKNGSPVLFPCENVIAAGSNVFVNAAGSGLYVIDVSDVWNPVLAGFLEMPTIKNVSKAGDVLYLACGKQGLIGVDVSTPREPRVAFRHFTGADFRAAVSAGNLLFTAAAGEGLKIYDLAAVPVLKEVGAYDTPGIASDLAVNGARLFVADGRAGVLVLDVTNPARPARVGGSSAVIVNPVVDSIFTLAVIDDRILASADRALQVLKPASLFRSVTVSIDPVGVFDMQLDPPASGELIMQRSADLREWRDWMPIYPQSELIRLTEREFSTAARSFYRIKSR